MLKIDWQGGRVVVEKKCVGPAYWGVAVVVHVMRIPGKIASSFDTKSESARCAVASREKIQP